MAQAREAREWARENLRGIGNSLYTPFAGVDGDDIDWEAYRYLVRYCVGELGHPMLWLTSGVGEFWSLTIDERKKLLEVAVEEARAINPDVVIQANTASTTAKDSLELTLHAQENGADIVYIQTPMMEAHGGEGTLRFVRYVADRTDVALGLFNSPSSGYVLTPRELADIAEAVPAVAAVKEGVMQPWRSRALHAMAPDLQVWECDTIVYRAGWLKQGIVTPAQLGTTGYLQETPEHRVITPYWELIWANKLEEAIDYAEATGMDTLLNATSKWLVAYPGRPGYFTHWGEAFKYCASVLGLPTGSYPHSRPPQGLLPDIAKAEIQAAYTNAGMVGTESRIVAA